MACTRVVYLSDEQNVITARSMDWKVDVGSNIWVLPNNVSRDGSAGKNSIKWTSKYGSVVTTGYDISTTDGMNEKGLAANLLWLVESEYPNIEKNKKPTLSISLWAQYILDNYSTVAEAVKALEKFPFPTPAMTIPAAFSFTSRLR